ncbi:MAG: acyl-CoA carboxylase subunit beta [Chloroflexi bacterium]|nr:acyl-CoA carboxylase subunit beta [Chloroflexota bacterium]MBU1751548.1 acyl-CoA carboxylase subunit beta [Chloroflexota bacterium]
MSETAMARLIEMEAQAQQGGGAERIAAQRARGKMTARERLEALLDPGTFFELDAFVAPRAGEAGPDGRRFLGDGVVVGWGQIDGRRIYVFAQDFTVLGGSIGETHGHKICKVLDLALENGAPVVGLNDSGGARIQEGVDALVACGEIFYRNTLASGVIPQISVIMGPCAGAAVYSPALTDFVVMVENTAQMFITGPDVIRAVTHQEISFEELGGAEAHHRLSGVAHLTAGNDVEALALVRRLLSFLPANNAEDPPRLPPIDPPDRADDELDHLVPDDPAQGYDMREVIHRVMDDGEFLEVQAGFAPHLVVGFARLGGHAVGLVAQQPAVLAGVLDIDAANKGSRFIRFCDCFNIPLITLADTPGFLPGVAQEHGGIIRHGAKMIYAYAEATVPKLSVITRKAYGGAYIVMSSKALRGDVCLAWPTAEIAVMGPAGAVNIVFRRELAQAEDAAAERVRLVQEYREQFANPYVAASRGHLDGVIAPRQTRPALIQALEALQNKRVRRPPRKHGNIPL